MSSKLDFEQIVQKVHDESSVSLKVRGVGGSLVPDQFDEVSLTYVAAGNGAGQIQTAVYKLAGVTVATLTISYDAQSRISDVQRS